MKKITLIIPIFNEEASLKSVLEKVDSVSLPCRKELIFVDDCSTDNSLQILKSYPIKSPFRILEQPKNQGKGAAIRRGLNESTGDFVAIQDADFEYDIEDLAYLIMPLLENKADVVYGSRFKKDGVQVHRTFHYMINRFLTILSNCASGLYLTDMETCYKVFRADVLKHIQLSSNRFGFEPEITAKIARLKLRIFEKIYILLPTELPTRKKKINWKDGVAALWHILYFNF